MRTEHLQDNAMEQVTSRTSNIFNLIMTIVIIAVAITPMLNRIFSEIMNVILFAVWVITIVMANVKINKGKDIIFSWIGVLLYQLIMIIIGHSFASPNVIIARTPNYMIPAMMVLIISNYNKKELKVLINAIFIIVALNLLSNIFIGFVHPEYFEVINLADEGSEEFKSNVGSTTFVTVCLFFIPIMLFTARYHKAKVPMMVLLFLASCYFIVILNARGVAVILLVLMIFGLLWSKRNHDILSVKSLLKLVPIILIIGYFIIPVLTFLAESFSELEGMAGKMAVKFSDISDLVSAGGNIEALGDHSFYKRIILWMTSWDSFTQSLSSFIWGIGENTHESDYYSLIKSGVGGHSEILDLLAMYGIIGGLIYYKAFKATFSFIIRQASVEIKDKVKFVLVIYIIYSICNTTLIPAVSFIVFFLFPIVLYYDDKYVKLV